MGRKEQLMEYFKRLKRMEKEAGSRARERREEAGTDGKRKR